MQLKGIVKKTTYFNIANNYNIVSFKDVKLGDITILGNFPKLLDKNEYIVEAKEIFNPKYGKQYEVIKIELFKDNFIIDKEKVIKDGIINFLGSSTFGVGDKTSSIIFEKYGTNSLDMILESPSNLTSIGIPFSRANNLYFTLNKIKDEAYVKFNLFKLGISQKRVNKIYEQFGLMSYLKVKDNPYELINLIEGIGFKTSDEIAINLGFDFNSIERIKAALAFTLKTYSRESGDIYITKEKLLSLTIEILEGSVSTKIDLEKVDESIKVLEEEGVFLIDYALNRIFFKYFFDLEKKVASHLLRLKNTNTSNFLSEKVDEFMGLEEKSLGICYTSNQKDAIKVSLCNGVSIITGGPGTGKTSIIRTLANIYEYVISSLDSSSKEVILLAPTGRAARRLHDACGNKKAYTIHKALLFSKDDDFAYESDFKLKEKVIIVDEASMIDLEIANRLLGSITDGSHLIIVGDIDQLPSVGLGMFLRDTINSNLFTTTYLDKIHRQKENSGIIDLAFDINNKEYNGSLSYSNVTFLKEKSIKEILDIMNSYLNSGYSIDDCQLLSTTYDGIYGIDTLNREAQLYLNPLKGDSYISINGFNYHKNDKILQTVNLKGGIITNGDIGKVIRCDSRIKELTIEFQKDRVDIYKDEKLDTFSLGYAMSIHKSQGSEFKIVFLFLKYSRNLSKKEIYYTGITRAKEHLYIIGDVSELVSAQMNTFETRKTTLVEQLLELNK
ncbi:MAG: ATP-dependent RecD-like DNA helicase [Acholeplasmatales bacterium]|jgi:exodeoxyribonuclease V alpha subunit|nr:ATP-dependent RecD-like DNA helicase [Acholeplasmatales bacterium]